MKIKTTLNIQLKNTDDNFQLCLKILKIKLLFLLTEILALDLNGLLLESCIGQLENMH